MTLPTSSVPVVHGSAGASPSQPLPRRFSVGDPRFSAGVLRFSAAHRGKTSDDFRFFEIDPGFAAMHRCFLEARRRCGVMHRRFAAACRDFFAMGRDSAAARD
jgi:hypothetical protein